MEWNGMNGIMNDDKEERGENEMAKKVCNVKMLCSENVKMFKL